MKILKKAAIVAIFLLLTCAFSIKTASSQDALQTVKDRGTLVIGFCAAYPPFESRNEVTGDFEGFDVDLGVALAEQLGVKAEFRDTEWPGLIAGVNKGDFDVLLSCMSKSETRGENVDMTDVYFQLSDVVVIQSDDVRFNSTEDIKGKIVGVQLGSAAEQAADKIEGLQEIRRFNYNPEAFLDLQHKRIDALIVGYAYAVNQIKTTSENFRVLGEVGTPSEVVMVLKKDSTSLTEALNKALQDIRSSGKYDEIVGKWLAID